MEKRTYTIKDFQFNTYAYKTIEETGRFNRNAMKYEINDSSILTKLIQEAGRWCEHYASDLFLNWQEVQRFLENAVPGEHEVFLFGFRQMGVDHDSFVINRFNEMDYYAKGEYRSLWRLNITTTPLDIGDKVIMRLGRVF